MIERTIEERRAFLQRLTKLTELGNEFDAACAAEEAARKRRQAARDAYVQYWIETESQFPNAPMPFYAESVWGPKTV